MENKLLGSEKARIVVDHLYDVCGKSKEAAFIYLTTGKETKHLDPLTKTFMDSGLAGDLKYLAKCVEEITKGFEKIEE